jgi:cob(I)alamin adenosyltransferase
MEGLVQVYTGNGKGKTTAALGLALRAAGAGLKVFIAQFVKGMEYSELKAIRERFPEITVRQYGRGCFIVNQPVEEDLKLARQGLSEVQKIIQTGAYDIVILDEANIAVYYQLFTVDYLLKIIRDKPQHVELVITGRKAHPQLIESADLVTEMREIKHYYQAGIKARQGIEL